MFSIRNFTLLDLAYQPMKPTANKDNHIPSKNKDNHKLAREKSIIHFPICSLFHKLAGKKDHCTLQFALYFSRQIKLIVRDAGEAAEIPGSRHHPHGLTQTNLRYN
jgi:hypothetical protein